MDTMDDMDNTDEAAQQVRVARSSLGFWLRNDHTFVRFTGTDAASWLQSQTTNDVLALESGQGHRNAALDRQGRLQAHFTLHRWQDEYWMLVERVQAPHLLKHLDDHLFIEEVQVQETGDELDQIVIQGPKSLPCLAQVLGVDHIAANELLPRAPHGVHPVELLGVEALAFRETHTGEDGYVLVVERGRGEALLGELDSLAREQGIDVANIGPDAQEILRIEAGIPKFGIDIDTTNVIAETTLDRDAVSHTKGCYLGQEVVARLKTYGSPKRALVGLIAKGGSGFQPERDAAETFDPFENPNGEVTRRQGAYLPHWTRDHATYFVTFRLAGTLPVNRRQSTSGDARSAFRTLEDSLHSWSGPAYLADPRVAKIVQDTLLHFHPDRYFLCAWSILSNHVHVVFRPNHGHSLNDILHSWKSWSATRANEVLNRRGTFWQDEYYDHLIRNEKGYWRCVRYTLENPERAGLIDWPWSGSRDLFAYFGELATLSQTHGLEARATSVSDIDSRQPVGTITSTCYSPMLNADIALASLDRDHRAPGTVVRVDGADAEVRALPLYEAPSREDMARDRYHRALELFERDREDTDPSAIPLLEEALLFDPAFEDAYEVLGVILHRHGRTDHAIRIMRQLAARNPDCLMAHTNLSVFYVAKGMIPEAEEEKARAAVLQIERAGAERRAKEVAESERHRLESEARERIRMFTEVLEIDPDDPLATFGLGKAYIQLNQFEDALPHLERATQVQKDYSAAYLDLGKCHEFLGHAGAAAATYRAGIAVASRKGDLMPMREMERRLKTLDAAVSSES